jgi:arylsulfatase A-like enzyme
VPGPNIVYVFADQMRGMSLGCLHDDPVQTPHVDRLAAEGVLFTNAVANTPVCTPSRASLVTGKHALSCRCFANDLRLPEEELTIADVLGRQGYRRGYVGKWHLDGISRHMFTPPGARRHGFDDYWAAYNCNHDYFDCKWYEDDSPALQRRSGYDADIQTDQAIAFMERFRKDPFCLFLSWGPPHNPYRAAPQAFLDMYPPEHVALRLNTEGAQREAVAGYYAHCSALDRNVGRLTEALDRLDLAGQTIFAFSSDHGDMLWSHGRKNKQQPYEESIRIPLIMRWPGHLPAGTTNDVVIGVVDHTPTLLGLCDLPVPAGMNGLDLSATILGRAGPRPPSAFIAEYCCFDQATDWEPWRGVRTERYTYARWREGGALLFDNRDDPYQLCNLTLRPGSEGLARNLEAELQSWLDRLNDRFMTGDDHIRESGLWEKWLVRQEHFYGVGKQNW